MDSAANFGQSGSTGKLPAADRQNIQTISNRELPMRRASAYGLPRAHFPKEQTTRREGSVLRFLIANSIYWKPS
jgi:hypothetical protein